MCMTKLTLSIRHEYYYTDMLSLSKCRHGRCLQLLLSSPIPVTMVKNRRWSWRDDVCWTNFFRVRPKSSRKFLTCRFSVCEYRCICTVATMPGTPLHCICNGIKMDCVCLEFERLMFVRCSTLFTRQTTIELQFTQPPC
jgi:hypothetical protein